MTSPNLQDWFYVELTLKSLEDGSSTTRRFSNRAIIDDSIEYYPLLRNISGVGSRMSDYLPYPISGQISIDVSEGSFEFERKFSDYLERYTIIDQSVKVYAAQTEIDDLNVTADFSLVATARATDWSIDNSAKLLNITISGNQIKPRVVTKVIDSTAFPSAPFFSLGAALPLVFGSSQEVPAIQIDADGDSSPAYAYATTLSTTFPVGGIQTFYARDFAGGWQAITNPATTSTALFQNTSETASLNLATKDLAFGLATPSSTCYILHGGKFLFRGSSAGTVEGEVRFELVEANPATLNSPNDAIVIATASIDKEDYSSEYQTNASFYVEFSFNIPAVMRANKQYYLVLRGSNETGSSITFPRYGSAGSTGGVWARYISVGTGTAWELEGSTIYGDMEFYGVVYTDTTSSAADADGFGYASFELTQKAAATGQTNPELTGLEIIVATNGIKDDGSGTITGAASTLLTQPKHVADLLDRQWNGSSWVAGSFDFTQFSSTHTSASVVRGATNGRSTFEDALTELCRNTCSRVSTHNGASKQLSFWQWGTTQSASAVITDEDSEILNIEERGIETVVNRFTFYYDRRYRDLDFTTGSAQGEFTNYAGTLDWYASKNYLTSHYSATSNTIFGTKPAAATSFDFIADSASATRLAEFIAARAGFPARYVELQVPFFKYRTLELLNIVEILHPALPAFFGTSANAKLPTHDGEDADLLGGNYWKRAQRYRAQIESKEIVFSPGGISTIRLWCRLLTNPKDPT